MKLNENHHLNPFQRGNKIKEWKCKDCAKFDDCRIHTSAQPDDVICPDFYPRNAIMIKLGNEGFLFIQRVDRKRVRIWLDKGINNTVWSNVVKVDFLQKDRNRKILVNKIAEYLETEKDKLGAEINIIASSINLDKLPIVKEIEEIYIPISKKFDEKRIIVEILDNGEPKFLVKDDNGIRIVREIRDGNVVYTPINDDLIRKKKIYLPTGIDEYESPIKLYEEVRQFLRKYVEVDPIFEDLATMYIFLTYFYEKCPVLPIFNIRGRSGTGKTRLATLMTMLSFYGMRASGALSFSSLFRYADKWKGTIFINEGDIKNPEVITYLLERPEKEGVVWRTNKETMKPEAFEAFGPTIITTRETFSDDALEDRCLVCLMNEKTREDIPLNLPPEVEKETERLRNKLLKFYLDHINKFENDFSLQFEGVNLRLQQILQPMLSLAKIVNPRFYEKIKEIIEKLNERIVQDRANSFDGRIIRAYISLKMEGQEKVTAKDIADYMLREWGIKANPISIGKRMAAMNFKTDRVSDKRRDRVKELDADREKILAMKYLPKEEREKYFRWRELQKQESLGIYESNALNNNNLSEMSEMSELGEQSSDKSIFNLSESSKDIADKSDKSDNISEYTDNEIKNDVASFKSNELATKNIESILLNLIPEEPKSVAIDAIMKEMGYSKMDADYEMRKEYILEKLKELAMENKIKILHPEFSRFCKPKKEG